jgi:hypothetical protein
VLRRTFRSKSEEENEEKYKMGNCIPWDRVLFETLTVAKLFNKFLSFYRT